MENKNNHTGKQGDFNRRGGSRGRRAPEDGRKPKNYPARETLPPEVSNDGEDGIHGDYENGAVIGRNAVRELLKSGRSVDKILVRKGDREGSIVVLVAEAISRGIPVIEVEKSKLDELSAFAPHQGVVAMAAGKEYCSVEDILQIAKDRGEAPVILIADGLTDPYNLGAVIRSAEGFGAHGLIIPKRRSVGITPLVTKASAGAVEHLAIAKVANLDNAVRQLQEAGVWVFAAEAGGRDYHETDFSGPCAVIVGSEGNGVSDLLKRRADQTVSIPMYGHINSFNVSAATAVLLAEIAKQHHKN